MANTGFRLRAARREAVYLAALAGLLSLAGLIVAARMSPGAPTNALTTLSSVLLTLAVGGLIYETVLRDSVASETIDLLGLRAAIAESSLRDIQTDSEVDWGEIFRQATKCHILVTTPFGWLEQVWPSILAAGGSQRIDVTVHLPDPKGATLPSLATRLGKTESDISNQLNNFTDHLSDSWTNATSGHSPIKRGSVFAIKEFDFVAPFDIVLTDTDVMLRIHSLMQVRPGDPTLVLRFKNDNRKFPVNWFAEQAERLEIEPSSWENTVS